eukprot:Rmarinus@m.10019
MQHACQKAVLTKNGVPLTAILSSVDLLRTYSDGVYTSARTFGQRAVFEFDKHVRRLADSVSVYSAKHPLPLEGEASKVITSYDRLRPVVLSNLASSMYLFQDISLKSEIKITMLLTWGQIDGFDLYMHLTPFSYQVKCPVQFNTVVASRKDPLAKHAEWAVERKVFEEQIQGHVNEVLLCEEDGSLSEGLSSNVFAVMDGTIFTTDNRILKGTVRDLVLEVCADEGIPVALEAPRLQHVQRWEACFITSTSRLVLPAQRLLLHPTLVSQLGLSLHDNHASTERVCYQEGGGWLKSFTSCPLVDQISAEVQRRIRDRCVEIIPA